MRFDVEPLSSFLRSIKCSVLRSRACTSTVSKKDLFCHQMRMLSQMAQLNDVKLDVNTLRGGNRESWATYVILRRFSTRSSYCPVCGKKNRLSWNDILKAQKLRGNPLIFLNRAFMSCACLLSPISSFLLQGFFGHSVGLWRINWPSWPLANIAYGFNTFLVW